MYILLYVNEPEEIPLKDRCAVVAETCAGGNLRRASRAVTQFYAEIMAPLGIEPTQFTLLTACAVAGPAPISVLADALAMDRTTLKRNVALLEKQELVSVREGRDRRVRVVELSAKGRATLVNALPLWEKAQSRIADGLGRVGLTALLNNLSAVVDFVRQA